MKSVLQAYLFLIETLILEKFFLTNGSIMWRLFLLLSLIIGACNSDAINPFLQETQQQVKYPDTTVLQLQPLVSVKYSLNDSTYFIRNFDEEHHLISETHYLNGKQDGPENRWDSAGQLLLDAYWLKGHRWGEYIVRYPSGLKQEQSTYDKAGKLLSRRLWHPNGQLESKAYYVDGEIDGQVVHYLEDGRMSEIFYYNKGEITYISVEYEGKTTAPNLLSDLE